jgi:RNA polymerase primary sigma factor
MDDGPASIIDEPSGLAAPIRLYAWQSRALDAWVDAGRRGVIAAVTAAGKTVVGIEAVRRHLHERNRFAKAVVVVPTIELMQQWERALRIRLPDVPVALLGGGNRGHLVDAEVLISVVNSAAEYVDGQIRSISSHRPVLLVADECHRLGAASFSRVLDAPFASTLGLSATPERAGDYGMEERVFPALGEVVFRYTHADGLADGVIADFGVAFIGVDLTAGERREYELMNDRVADALNRLLDQHWRLREIDDRREFFAAVQMLVNREDPAAEAFMAAVGKRSGIVISAARRLELVRWLFEHARPAGKALLFHERIASCEELAEALSEMGVSAEAHHSELAKDERRSVLDAFARGRTRVLVAPRTLDEGIDVPDAEVAIIVSGSSVGRQAIQRIGRVLRPAPGKGFARIGLIYARGCQDDPRTSESLDGLAAAVEEMGRAWWFEAAHDRPAIAAFFTADRLPERLPERHASGHHRAGATAAVERRAVRSESRELDPAPPPTFAETRSEIARLRRLSGANQPVLRRRLERNVKDRVSWELERIMQLPEEQAKSQLIRLSLRRDQILTQIESAASSR